MTKQSVNQMVDILYILGSGSCWSDNEIRYSLRSVTKNLSGVRSVFVVGEKPAFLQNIIHIPCPDHFSVQNAAGNAAIKILAACADDRISDTFLLMNDDFIVLKPMEAGKVTTYHKGDFSGYLPSEFVANLWRQRMKHTFDTLKAAGLPTMNYDYHAPMLIDKQKFAAVMNLFDWKTGIGLLYRSVYGNYYRVEAEELTSEKRTLFAPVNLKTIEDTFATPLFMAFSDKGLNLSLKQWLKREFPLQSLYETTDVEGELSEIEQWLSDPSDFAEGVRLFIKYSPDKKLTPTCNLSEKPILTRRLIAKFKTMINQL